MKRVAIVGTQGVPARYGGFETLVENIIGDNCSSDIQYTVFCSSKDMPEKIKEYKGAILKYIPVKANGMQSTIYDTLSLLRCIRGYDTIVVLGVSGGIFYPIFRLFCWKRFVVNIDGLEWKRNKWSKFAKRFLKLSEKVAVFCSDVIIADNQGIVDYVTTEYHKHSELIAYGGDHVVQSVSEEKQQHIFEQYNLIPHEYAISICRIEPENNCHVVLEAYAQTGKRIIFIGNWERSQYGKDLKTKYSSYSNITIQDPVYALDILYVLRHNCKTYIHGHSAGGTNPSLVEAMYCACNIVAFDVVYNRETTENKALYFKDGAELRSLIQSEQYSCSEVMYEIAKRRYAWSVIAKQYEALY